MSNKHLWSFLAFASFSVPRVIINSIISLKSLPTRPISDGGTTRKRSVGVLRPLISPRMKSLVEVLSAMIFSPKMSNAVIAVDNTEPPSPSGLDKNAPNCCITIGCI